MYTLIRIFSCALFTALLCPARAAVVVPAAADAVEKLAASELVAYLARIYPAEEFAVADREPSSAPSIALSVAPESRRASPFGHPEEEP